MIADYQDGKIILTTDFVDRDLVRQVPGARWDKSSGLWSLPAAWTACKVLRGVFGDRLEITEALNAWAWNEWTTRIEPASKARLTALDMTADAPGHPELYPYQRTSVDFLTASTMPILADDMGTGKTVMAIAWAERVDAYPLLVVCPPAVKRGFEREFHKWAPNRSVMVLAGTAAKRAKAIDAFRTEGTDVLIINYEQARAHSRLAGYGSVALRRCMECGGEDPDVTAAKCEAHAKGLNGIEWGGVIADEAHKLRDAKSKQTRAVKAAAGTARYRLAMTGTPIGDTPDEAWSILNFVAPLEWPTKGKYRDRYCLTSWNGFGDEVLGLRPEMRDEFYECIDPHLLRRPIDLVRPQMPPLVTETRYVAMTPKQSKAYRSMEEKLVSEIEGGTIAGISTLAQLTRLGQFASAVAELDDDGNLHLTAPSCKVDALVEITDELAEPFVVFAQSRQLIDLCETALAEKGITYGRITGAENDERREWALKAFRDGKLRVMLLTLGAGGTGLDGLQHTARVAVFLERGWSLLERKQAIGRLRRVGQEGESVLIIDVVSEATLEEEQMDALEGKADRLEEVVRDALAMKGKK